MGSKRLKAVIEDHRGKNAEAIIDLGMLVLKAEREFNRKAGLTEKDDNLPKFF